ncbi:MAG TPA: polysaccharide deacetylase family protein [Hyphomicrobiaceae bacterium]|nr:polysaccharide deacetylase family protein [Hyphomicrobiaceae bacterium]
MTMNTLVRIALLSVILESASPAPILAGERAALQAACWQPAALAAKPGEELVVRASRQMRVPDIAGLSPEAALPAAGTVRRVLLPPGQKLIALTFDLCETSGETAGYDGGIVDYLRSQQVKATFFAGGHWMASHKARTQQLLSDPLFEIGTHGWAHRNTRLMGGLELQKEILAPSAVYTSIRSELSQAQCAAPLRSAFASIPDRPNLFRFPFGACSPESLAAVAGAGLIAIQWDVATGDPSPYRSARAIADAMIRNARPGSIVVSHANGRGYHTGEALPLAIPALRAKGYSFVTVSELLSAGKPVLAQTCYDAHPGDTDRYDFPKGPSPTASPSWETTTHVRAGPSLPR